MEQQNNEPVVQKNKSPKSSSLKKNPTIIALIALAVATSVFSTGFLVGSGKLSLRSNGIVPVIERASGNAPRTGIDELYSELLDNFDGEISQEDILDGQKAGLVRAAGDPFTEYLSAEKTKDFNESLNGQFEGIGAELGKEGSFVVIVSPIKGTPADRAGILPQDIIIEIDGESAADITISEAVDQIRGPKGETVTLTIIRDGQQVVVPIVRDTISIASVESTIEGDLGILTISRFGDDTSSLSKAAAQEFKAAGVTKVIVDLRGNPGGLLDSSVEVSSIWLNKGSTVLEEKRNGEIIQTFKTSTQPILGGVPTIVLINEGSASASEIVAGALKDNGAATLLGVTSYGKGSVQRLLPLNDGGSLKVTIARWFTPAGKNIDKEGIDPDTTVERSGEDRQADLDPQLDAAKSAL
jgi:carboxyl-terminal processing protease